MVTPASRISARAALVVSAATPAHRSGSTRVAKPVAHGVERGRAHAVVGGDPAHVDVVDLVGAQPVGQRGAVRRTPLEAGVRRRVLALEEDRVEGLRVEVGVERLPVGADLAVHRPRVDEVGLADQCAPGSMWWSLVATTSVVRPARRASWRVQWCSSSAMSLRDLRAAGHRQRAALAEVVLDVDDDQCALHAREPSGERPHSAAYSGSVVSIRSWVALRGAGTPRDREPWATARPNSGMFP